MSPNNNFQSPVGLPYSVTIDGGEVAKNTEEVDIMSHVPASQSCIYNRNAYNMKEMSCLVPFT